MLSSTPTPTLGFEPLPPIIYMAVVAFEYLCFRVDSELSMEVYWSSSLAPFLPEAFSSSRLCSSRDSFIGEYFSPITSADLRF